MGYFLCNSVPEVRSISYIIKPSLQAINIIFFLISISDEIYQTLDLSQSSVANKGMDMYTRGCIYAVQ